MIRVLFSFFACLGVVFAAPVKLASEGEAILPIVVHPDAPAEVTQVAEELAQSLQRITGALFKVRKAVEADAALIVGLATEWPGHLPIVEGQTASLTRDDYLLKTGDQRLWVLARTPHGLRNALWGFLHELGFRHFFPGPTWEVWPQQRELSVELNRVESPSYYTRRIGMNIWPENRELWQQWQERNRMVSGFHLHTSHVYGEIIRKNPAHFEENPDDIAPYPEGKQGISKLDPSRPTVLEVATRYALETLEKDPSRDTISMDPSDGGYWRMDSPLGSPSNQAVTLANHVARAVAEQYPGKKVGLYAYNEHSPAPEIDVEKNVIVSVATAFVRDSRSPLQLMKAWHGKGAEIGIREYLSVWPWGNDLPGRSRASDLDYVFETIPNYHANGARYWITEATAGWGVNGLGNYLSARLLWDAGLASEREALVNDFFDRAFEGVAPEARAFYACVLAEKRPMLSEDLIGRMYRALDAALAKSPSEAVTARLLDLARYTGFVERMFLYQNSQGSQRQAAYDEMARWVYRLRATQMVDGRGPFGDLPHRDRTVKAAGWFAREGEHPLKVGDLMVEGELREMIAAGVGRWKLNDFEPVAYQGALRPVEVPEGEPENLNRIGLRGTNRLYLHAEPGRKTFEFTVSGGHIYQDRGLVRIALFADAHPFPDQPVATVEVEPDREQHSIVLETTYEGGHTLEIADGAALTHLQWPSGQRLVVPAGAAEKTISHLPFTGVFYVPKGTKVIGGYSDFARGIVKRADGSFAYDFKRMQEPGYFSIPVPEGTDDGFWRLEGARGSKVLLTVPSFYGRSISEMLVPEQALE